MSSKNLELYNRALNLRLSGKSYNQIYKEIGVAKSTLSGWFSNQSWPQIIRNQLAKETRTKIYQK